MNLHYNDSGITCKDYSKYLILNLNFKTHIQLFATKISRSTGILSILRFLFPSSTDFTFYTGYSRIYDPILILYKIQTGKDSTKAIIFSERS